MDFMGTGDLLKHLRAKGLAVTERQIDFHLRAGHLSEPPRRLCGARIWELEDIIRAEIFFQKKDARTVRP